MICLVVQVLEEEVGGLTGQVSLLEDQLKMASVASQQKLGEAQQRHRDLGHKLQELVRLHRELETHLEV